MKTIWKFPLMVVDEQTVMMPAGAELLCVQAQSVSTSIEPIGERACVWALVDPSAPLVSVALLTYGTGHPIAADHAEYIDTYQLHNGALVFHVFRAIP